MAGANYVVLLDFQAVNTEELSIKAGQTVKSLSKCRNGAWIKVELNGKHGLVPKGYLKLVGGSPPVSTRTPVSAPVPVASGEEVPVASVVATEHAECVLCYQDLAMKLIVGMNGSNGKRSCNHYVHQACMGKRSSKTCPVCSVSYSSLALVPNFDENPSEWFKCVDVDANGQLSKVEVYSILKSLMLINFHELQENIDVIWPRWDLDGNGQINFQELCDPKSGLLVYVRSHFQRLRHVPPPPLSVPTKEVWFHFWDDNDNGSLQQEEIVRAIVKTFDLSENPDKIQEIREIVTSIWAIFDSDSSGSVEFGEFLSPDGLGDSLCASLQRI